MRRCPRGPRGRGHAPGGQARPGPSWPPRKAVGALLSSQESQYPDKNRVQISAQSDLRISENIRNGERAELGNTETERDRETDPISEGLSHLPRHGGHGPEGKPFSHLGRRSRKKKKKEGGLSPPRFQWHRSATGAIIVTAIFTNNFTAVITNSSPLYAVV